MNHSFQKLLTNSRTSERLSQCWQLSGLAEGLRALLLPPSVLSAIYSSSYRCPKYVNLCRQEEVFGYLGAFLIVQLFPVSAVTEMRLAANA